MIWFIASIAVQVLLIIHCVKTGRNTLWIWVLALLSFPGVIAYIAVEVLPELFGSRAARRTARSVKGLIDPTAGLRKAEQAVRATGDINSRQRYAEELIKQTRHREAIDVYRSMLTGLYATDPHLMLGLASAQFGADDFAAARDTLDQLIAANPEFKSADGHLLYARALEGVGEFGKALDEYRALTEYYPGPEAAVRYARLLRAQDRKEESRTVLRALLDRTAAAPAHFRKAQREWLDEAEREAG